MWSINVVYIKNNKLKVNGQVVNASAYRLLNDNVMQAKLLEKMPHSKQVWLVVGDNEFKNWTPLLTWIEKQGFHIRRLPTLKEGVDLAVIAMVILIIGTGLWLYQLVRLTAKELRESKSTLTVVAPKEITPIWALFMTLSQAPLVPDHISVTPHQFRLKGFVPSQNCDGLEEYVRQIHRRYPKWILVPTQGPLSTSVASYIAITGELR